MNNHRTPLLTHDMSLEQPKMHYGVWKCDVERYIALFPVESIAQQWVKDNGPSRDFEIHDLNKKVMPEKQPYKRKTLLERCRPSAKL